jgi:predicted nucleic acid-binding Zn ribbon protein
MKEVMTAVLVCDGCAPSWFMMVGRTAKKEVNIFCWHRQCCLCGNQFGCDDVFCNGERSKQLFHQDDRRSTIDDRTDCVLLLSSLSSLLDLIIILNVQPLLHPPTTYHQQQQ